MTTCKEERGDGGCSQSRRGREAPASMSVLPFYSNYNLQDVLLSQVDFLMPLSPDLGRREHTTRATHVSKGSLTGTVSTSS